MRAIFHLGEKKYWNIGASLIMKKSTFELIGRWAEDYFMYTEDMEVFYVADQKNIPVRYLDTKIVHIGKVSSGNRWSNLQRCAFPGLPLIMGSRCPGHSGPSPSPWSPHHHYNG